MSEEHLKKWDGWRKYIAEGGTASWPRDEFESLIENMEAENAALRAQLEAASKQEPILWVDMFDVDRFKPMDIPVRCIHRKYDKDYSPLYAYPPIPKEKT